MINGKRKIFGMTDRQICTKRSQTNITNNSSQRIVKYYYRKIQEISIYGVLVTKSCKQCLYQLHNICPSISRDACKELENNWTYVHEIGYQEVTQNFTDTSQLLLKSGINNGHLTVNISRFYSYFESDSLNICWNKESLNKETVVKTERHRPVLSTL